MTTIPDTLDADIRRALEEDVGSGDLTAGLIPADRRAEATVIAREPAVICGQPWFDEVFARLGGEVQVTWNVAEGDRVEADTTLCTLSGNARAILTGERTALNFLQTLSATATAAAAYATAVSGTKARILDTRKTLPGLRDAQKYAVRIAGAVNHRTGLYDGVLIKENHIAAAGSITAAVAEAVNQGITVLIEVEVENLEETREALETQAQRLLLDNFSHADLKAAVALRDELSPDTGLEASGGITLENVAGVAACGVDYISVGAITKDVKALDLSMRFAFSES